MLALHRWRHETCDGVTEFEPLDQLDGVAALAGTQRMQTGLPLATQAVWREVARRWPRLTGLGAWGDRAHRARKSCHNRGLALDCMTFDAATHAEIVQWALANRSQYKITLIISRRRKWSAATGWKPRPYVGASPHNDHVHLSIAC